MNCHSVQVDATESFECYFTFATHSSKLLQSKHTKFSGKIPQCLFFTQEKKKPQVKMPDACIITLTKSCWAYFCTPTDRMDVLTTLENGSEPKSKWHNSVYLIEQTNDLMTKNQTTKQSKHCK